MSCTDVIELSIPTAAPTVGLGVIQSQSGAVPDFLWSDRAGRHLT